MGGQGIEEVLVIRDVLLQHFSERWALRSEPLFHWLPLKHSTIPLQQNESLVRAITDDETKLSMM